jgi:hypothetical protein
MQQAQRREITKIMELTHENNKHPVNTGMATSVYYL